LKKAGLKPGKNIYLAYSPEREDPNNAKFSTASIPKLVGGTDATSGKLATMLYEQIIGKVVPVSSAEVAEAAKLLENIFRSVNIALVNELKKVRKELAKSNSAHRKFWMGVTTGFGTVIGATVVVAVVLLSSIGISMLFPAPVHHAPAAKSKAKAVAKKKRR
jgi:hypothetical protein